MHDKLFWKITMKKDFFYWQKYTQETNTNHENLFDILKTKHYNKEPLIN